MNCKLFKSKKYSIPKTDTQVRKLIHGENLTALDLLMPEYKGKVKCIYMDPPYNNGESYTHYNDRIQNKWILDIEERLKRMHKLLSKDGSIWISIDDNEMHYLKVAADSIFERKNFISTIIWQQRTTRENRKNFSNNHEYILVYAKNKNAFSLKANKLPATKDILKRYKNPDNDSRGLWQSISLNVQDGHAVKSQFYKIYSPSGKSFNPPKGRCWAYNKKKIKKLQSEEKIWFGFDGKGVPRLKKYLSESYLVSTPETLWMANDVGTNEEAKKHLLKLFSKKPVFDTPKPEKLLQRIFTIASNQGDLILDAYVGSGASIAVAHKMNRQYIGIDKGKQIIDYALQRQKLIFKERGLGISIKKLNKKKGLDFYNIVS